MPSEEQKIQARMISLLASKMAPEGQTVVLNMLVGALTTDPRAQNMMLVSVRDQAEEELREVGKQVSKAFEAVE